ncbi:cytochrome c biogenesis protein CcmE [Rhodospirillum rubrum]|uniref:cytochrome c maturation protein CcmE n=1 Tax=Rhodospirillum rubrum TaxID=1085 RepID=UPI001907B7E7|nr:cytochrome c maturation protein CcmE [Rhodospirillum rubrum]MBK1677954.1 cytochrome c biogenesis protein CcmE [Rhodospirillum rubrum]
MTRKKRRLYFVVLGMVALFAAAGLTLTAFQDNLVFFYSPTDLQEKGVDQGRRFRVGGLVEEGSVVRDGETVRFTVTDLMNTVTVRYTGMLPDLFREGQGVVAEGAMDGAGTFVAANVLAKHDENYMPPEVAESLKASGKWQHGPPTAAAAPAP